MEVLRFIPLDLIVPNPQQPRHEFDHDELLSLGQSIKSRGLIQPIIVEDNEDETFTLHDGERRWRASRLVGLTGIKSIVLPHLNGAGDQVRALNAFVSNFQRASLNPIEEALALSGMVNMGMTHKRIGAETGLTEATVASRLMLLELDSELQDLIAKNLLPRDPRVTRALRTIVNPEIRVKFGIRMARPGITIPAILNAVERLNEQLAQQQVVAEIGTPAIALGAPKGMAPEQVAKWKNIKAATSGMCDACDANPDLPDVPEPAWAIIMQSATQTCDACNLRTQAQATKLLICKQCPAVELLKRLVGGL